jgi:uncharacterized phiE125 gp8 family phage protein
MTLVFPAPENPDVALTPYRSLVRTSGPAVEPVTLAEAKAHCRVDHSTDDALISALIAGAREYVEGRLDVTLITTTWTARYDNFPSWEVVLPRPPMLAGTVTVTYRNPDGQSVSMSSATGAFQVDSNVIPGRIYPKYLEAWPPTRGDENSVTVQWSAGYGASGTSVPQTIRHGVLLLVGHWYANREAVTSGQMMEVPMTFETLMAASGWGGYR